MKVGVEVGVKVVVAVGVAVAAETVWVFPTTDPPVRMAPCPVLCPLAVIPTVARPFEKVLFTNPDTLRSNTSRKVCGSPEASGGVTPFKFWKVTDPCRVEICPPHNKLSVPAL